MEKFDGSRFYKALANSKLYIIFVLVLTVTIGYFYSCYYLTPMYSSSSTVMLVQKGGLDTESKASITQADITLNQNLLSTYTKIAKSDRVIEQVIKNLKLDMSVSDLYENISVQSINNTEAFKISVNNQNPQLAANITNELVKVFINEVKTLYNMNNVYTMDEAKVSSTPFNINHVKDFTIFGAVGIVVSLSIVILMYLFDTTIKSEQDVEEYTGLSVLSTIPVSQEKSDKELIVYEQPKSSIAEHFKTFRNNVMFSIRNKYFNTILITSGGSGEGKSFISSNLATTFAGSGKRVILIDTDMRKGRMHEIFDVSNKMGLSDCLSAIGNEGDSVNINKFIQKSGIPNLHLMTSGTIPPNPSELLSSPNMRKFLRTLNIQYDIVICDGSPCMLVSDSIILSKIVDTTVIVTANRVTKIDNLLKIKKSIENVGGNIGGVIINKIITGSKFYPKEDYHEEDEQAEFDIDLWDKKSDDMLKSKLHIIDNIDEIAEQSEELQEDNTNQLNSDFYEISDRISGYNQEILELKRLYKDGVQDTIDSIVKDNDSNINILKEELKDIKKYTDPLLSEIQENKTIYKDSIESQNEVINSIEDKIVNSNVGKNSELILEELTELKGLYKNAMQNTFDAVAKSDTNDMIADELTSIKNFYEDSLQKQNEKINNLNEKFDNIDFSIYTDPLMNEIQENKTLYTNTIENQNEAINSLESKISNINNETLTTLLNEMRELKESYQQSIEAQNNRINMLDNKISELKQNNKTILANEVSNIYDQLSNMKSKFEYVEHKKIRSQKVDNNIETATVGLKNNKNKELDIAKLNEKVVRLKDYLENENKETVGLSNDAINSTKKVVEEEPIRVRENIRRELIQAATIASRDNKLISEYEKDKEKRGLFSFKAKDIEPIYESENEEEVTIVSQILA